MCSDHRKEIQAANTDGWLVKRAITSDGKWVQVVLLLETEEVVAAAHLLPSLRAAGVGSIRRLQQEVHEVTQDVLFTSFTFTIPHEAPASFETAVVALRWRLRFEFLVRPAERRRWGKPYDLVWALPLSVRPP